jgi:copper transport protein
MTARGLARLLAFCLALLIGLAHAPETWAHASLVKAVPADGAVLPLPPAALTLTFNEPVSPLAMRLIGPNGDPITPHAVVADNATVTITAPPTLQQGTHVLSWRVISADGHPVGGSLIFSIGSPSAQPAAGAESLAGSDVRAALWTVKVIIYGGLLIGVGGAFFRAWIADPFPCAAQPWIVAVLVAGLLAAPLSVGLQGLDAVDLPLSGLAQKAAWEAGLETAYGVTVIAIAFALFAGLFAFAAKSARVARGLSLTGLLGVGLALALSGHASTAEPRLVSRMAVFLHAVAVAFWIGSLLPLYLGVRASALRASTRIGPALKRFSRAIPFVILALVVSGLWLAVVQLHRVDALWTTPYGQVLACKLACVLALFGLATANRYRLVSKFETQGAAAARPLATLIALELAIALVILGLVALWRFTPPPRASAADAPISLHIHGEKAMAEIEIERDGGQGARARVLVLDGAFRPLAVKEVTLVLANPAAGIEPMRRTAMRAGDPAGADAGSTIWRIEGLLIPVAGRWSVRVEILISDFEKLTIEDTIPLPRVP